MIQALSFRAAMTYAGSLALVAGALVAGLVLQRASIHPANFALVFLIAVLWSGIAYGLWPALFASLLSVVAYNFFFLPPLYTFVIADPSNLVTLFFFGVVAIVASNLAARARAEAVAARERAATMESLYLFSRKLAEVFTLDDLLWAICFQIAHLSKARVVALLPEAGALAVRAGYPPEDSLSEADLAQTQAIFDNRDAAAERQQPGRLFLPLRTGRGNVGVVRVERDGNSADRAEGRRLLEALADQAALAIERLNLAQDIERVRLAAETERLRSAMLASLSHDLRTPLASIVGSASSLRTHRRTLDESAQNELIATIEEEAARLHRFIVNLLDMTRLESGALAPTLELVDVSDVAGTALRRAAEILREHAVEIDMPPDLPLLKLDPVLFEQVLFNLLDNAAKYAPGGTRIAVRARRMGQAVHIEVADRGPGIPPDRMERIFDKFYRAQPADKQRAGTGLGLAICRGFLASMDGAIAARNRAEGGAAFAITLPIPARQPALDAA